MDIDAKSCPTVVADILKWDFKTYPKGYFDFVWASPLCTYYSIARSTKKSTPEELAYADSLVQKSLEIIKYFGAPWAFENPASGRLKGRPFLVALDLQWRDVTYCMYNGPGYKKQTRIWNNLGSHWKPLPICCKTGRCRFFANNMHPLTAQRGPCRSSKGKRVGDGFTQNQLYHIPAALCDEIALAAESALRENAPVHQEGPSVEREATEELRRN